MFKDDTKNRLNEKKEMRLITFILGLFTAAAFFVPFIVNDNGYFIFFGDFNVQQIPFYQYCHQMVRSGQFYGWDFGTDLGANFIPSYSFYLLGSPFFWLTLPFPNSWVPYLMGPLLILKFACASLTGYIYIRRFTARPESATIGGLLYAFSGFSCYNIFFNHFHEAIVVFPLLLWAIEKFMAEKSRGWLAFAVFLSVLTNYFFFFGMVVFVIIYWTVRMCSKSFKFKISEFFIMLFECVLGLLLSAAVLLPTVIEVLQNDRLSSVMSGWGAVMYGKEQIFLNVIECFFFPPDLPARPVFFPGADVKWSSLGGWLPLFGMTGAICWLKSEKKGHWIRRVLAICIVMALIPGLNAAFSMFNTAYYARWFFMPILIMSLATATALEDTKVDWNSAWRWSFFITLAFTVVIGFMPTINYDTGEITKWGLYTDAATNPFKYVYQVLKNAVDGTTHVDGDFYDLRFWVTCAIALGSCVVVKMLIPLIKEKKSSVFKPIIALICIVSIIYSAFFISCGQSHSYERDTVMTDALIEGKVSIEDDPDGFSRVDVYDGVDNTGLYLGLSSINFFNSIVPASIVDYYEFIGVGRSVASRAETKYSALRPFLSVKYVLDPHIENSKEFMDSNGQTVMPNYSFYSDEGGYLIYKNENYIPMGFTYDYYIDGKTLVNYKDERRVNMMLKALMVENKDIPKISQYLADIHTEYSIDKTSTGIKPLQFNDESLQNDCEARRKVCADTFKVTKNGFTASISMDRDNLVFFSVPYHEGWTATVNGKSAEIFRVNKSFMAVVVPEGVAEIKFTFETPGLFVGIIITLAAIAVFAAYIGLVVLKRNYRPTTPFEYPEGDEIADRIRLYDAANYAAEHPDDDYLLDNIDRSKIDAYVGFKGGFKLDDTAVIDFNTGKFPKIEVEAETGSQSEGKADGDTEKPTEKTDGAPETDQTKADDDKESDG